MPGLNPTEQDLQHFIEITGADTASATHFLENGTTLQGAIEDYFAAREAGGIPSAATSEDPDDDDEEDEEDEAVLEEALMADNEQRQQAQQASGAARDTGAGGSGGQGAGGPRTLGGQAIDTSLPEGWGKKERKLGRVGEWGGGSGGGSKSGGGIGIFGSNGPGGPSARVGGFGGGGGDDDDDDDDDDDYDDARRGEKELYAGGEKSGLAVENPDQNRGGRSGPRGIVGEILNQARQAGRAQAESERPAAPRSGFFGGTGNTLGSDETPSVTIPAGGSAVGAGAGVGAGAPSVAPVSAGMFDSLLGGLMGRSSAPAPAPPPEEEEKTQTRSLIFWRNGFSIEDGPLMEYDAPGNQEILRAIQSGRAPPSLFGVRYNQPLQVEVQQRTGEEYVRQMRKKGRWEGEGNRLGSPTPAIGGSGSSTPGGILEGGSRQGQGQGQGVPVSQGGSIGNTPNFQVDETKPTTSIQLRLADGSKLVAKVNLTHTIRDLRNFISASRPDSRQFVLQTTFPSKELTDEDQTVEEAGLKNAVVVQRYV